MKRLVRIGVVAALFAGSSWAQGARLPEWVAELPSASGQVYAVGMASLAEEGSDAKAIARAGEAAKVELLSSLRSTVGSTLTNKETLNAVRKGDKESSTLRQEAEKSTTITTSARDLPGLQVSETFVDRDGGSVYALAVLDLAAAGGELRRRQEQMDAKTEALRADDAPSLATLGEATAFLGQNAKSLELASLLSSRLGAQAGRLQSGHDTLKALVASRKKTVTFGLDPQSASGRDTGALRTAVTAAGYAWSKAPRYTFAIEDVAKPRSDFSHNRHVAKGSLTLVLQDRDGLALKTRKITSNSAGSSADKALAALNRNLDEEIAATVSAWLGGKDEGETELAADGAAESDTGRAGLTPGSDDRPVDWGRR